MSATLRYLHILLFVAWLGIDVGVFSSSVVIRRPGLSGETRVVLRRLMRGLDLAPRLSLVLMVPVAVALAHTTGKGALGAPAALLWALAAAALLWCAVQLWSFRAVDALGPPAPAVAARVRFLGLADAAVRVVAGTAFLATGIWSIAGDGPWVRTTVAWKALIFGLVVFAGLWIRHGGRAFGPALRRVVAEGESPERLRVMSRAMWRIYPAVIGIWAALLTMAAIAVLG